MPTISMKAYWCALRYGESSSISPVFDPVVATASPLSSRN
jgi:hypothetical protein